MKVVFVWWGWRGSPLRLWPACASRCAGLGGAARSLKTPTPRRFLDAASSPIERKPNKKPPVQVVFVWWGWRGSNPRPLRCERSALTNWATSPRKRYFTVSGEKWQALFTVLRGGIFMIGTEAGAASPSAEAFFGIASDSSVWFCYCTEYSSASVQYTF